MSFGRLLDYRTRATPEGAGHTDWSARAACRDEDPNLWDPDVSDDLDLARRICDACPVKMQCLEAAMDEEGRSHYQERGTIRAGLDGQQRYALHRKRIRSSNTALAMARPTVTVKVRDAEAKQRQAAYARARRAAEKAGVPLVRPPRPVAPCGTTAAYDRHSRRGEPIDPACAEARRAYRAAKRQEGRP